MIVYFEVELHRRAQDGRRARRKVANRSCIGRLQWSAKVRRSLSRAPARLARRMRGERVNTLGTGDGHSIRRFGFYCVHAPENKPLVSEVRESADEVRKATAQ